MWPFGSSNAGQSNVGRDGTPSTVATEQPTMTTATSTQMNPVIETPRHTELSREEQANLDFQNLMKEINDEQSRSAVEEQVKARKSAKPKAVPTSIDISPDALYPTEMSCKSAFDYGMFCSAFGGQFVNVYRYGTWRSCSNHWADFWLCMRTKGMPEEERKKTIQNHYKMKAAKFKTGPSSEDVWEVRTEPVKDPFQENFEKLEEDIERWKTINAGTLNPWATK